MSCQTCSYRPSHRVWPLLGHHLLHREACVCTICVLWWSTVEPTASWWQVNCSDHYATMLCILHVMYIVTKKLFFTFTLPLYGLKICIVSTVKNTYIGDVCLINVQWSKTCQNAAVLDHCCRNSDVWCFYALKGHCWWSWNDLASWSGIKAACRLCQELPHRHCECAELIVVLLTWLCLYCSLSVCDHVCAWIFIYIFGSYMPRYKKQLIL